MARRYPLEPLLAIRRERVERQASAHQSARERSDRQAALASAARERREGSERALATDQAEERQRLEAGSVRAHDLQQGERHRAGVTAQLAVERALEVQTAGRANEAAQAAEAERSALARARAEEEAVLTHERRFHEAAARAEELGEEADAADHVAATRAGARRS